MTMTIIAALCILACVALWHNAFRFDRDAAPIGSMMLVGSIGFGVAGVFLFGVAVGQAMS